MHNKDGQDADVLQPVQAVEVPVTVNEWLVVFKDFNEDNLYTNTDRSHMDTYIYCDSMVYLLNKFSPGTFLKHVHKM